MLNYPCPRELLEPLVPTGTALDTWQGVPLVSLVAFLFADTRLAGVPVPFHRTFEEANLRFYVRRTAAGGEQRRGVVFIRELVPKPAIAATARWAYNEPYLAVPMSHRIALSERAGGHVAYEWRYGGLAYGLYARVSGAATAFESGSEGEFITEHYWGYTRRSLQRTTEYRVAHPRWQVRIAQSAKLECNPAALYGPPFAECLTAKPVSAVLAEGSEVTVYRGTTLQL
jgi:uncharacterized protein YqjF (DUF2071 family)